MEAERELKYQWYRAGKAISGATKSTCVLVAADAGNAITVAVTGSRVPCNERVDAIGMSSRQRADGRGSETLHQPWQDASTRNHWSEHEIGEYV